MSRAVARSDRKTRNSWDSDFGFRCGFNGGDFRLVADFDADDRTELATFCETADEAVTYLRQYLIEPVS